LGLFDIWVENDDRKPSNTNVLFDTSSGKINIIAIDNAYTFTTQNYNQLLSSVVCQSYNDNLLHTKLVKEITKYAKKQQGFSEYIKDYFYFCISKSKENYYEIVENVPFELGLTEELADALFAFLFSETRNQKVLIDFYSKL